MRTAVMTFDDNEAAETFARVFEEAKDPLRDHLVSQAFVEMGAIMREHASLDALVARPTKGCQCGTFRERGRIKPMGNWSRTPRFGWWIHNMPGCKRPSKTVVRDFIKNMIIGSKDLLPELFPDRDPVPEHDLQCYQEVVEQHRRSA